MLTRGYPNNGRMVDDVNVDDYSIHDHSNI